MCSYPPKKNHSQFDRTTVSMTEPQFVWQNHSQIAKTTVRLREPLNKWDWPGLDISKPYIPFNHMLQAHCLQSFAVQPIRIKDSSAVINALILLVDRQCHHHTAYSDSLFYNCSQKDTQTHRRTTLIPSRLSAGNKHFKSHYAYLPYMPQSYNFI